MVFSFGGEENFVFEVVSEIQGHNELLNSDCGRAKSVNI